MRHSEGRERVLLLPLSFGPCSISLLYVLNQHLKGQAERTGRTGFKLHILHVEKPGLDSSLLHEVKERFPEYHFSTVALSEVLSQDGIQELLHQYSGRKPGLESERQEDTQAQLEDIISNLASLTSRDDVTNILLQKVVVHFAKLHGCEAVLWGDSTTRLAERTLAETAKGRGSALPWLVADGDALHGVPFYYPMRDLLTKEIASFASLVDPPLDGLINREAVKPAVSTRNTTIDDLMKQYFESVEQEYPSIVANVVKTTSKLQTTPLSQVEKQCELCDVPLTARAPDRSRLCYGCIRTLPATSS